MSPVAQTLADLIRINSVNPAYQDGPGEQQCARYIERFFQQRGIATTEHEVFPGRPNIIARIPGRDRSQRIIFEAHTDTVTVQGMTIPPFEPTVADGKMYGRGSCDTKAGLAAMMHAMADIHASGSPPPCDLWLAAVVDEEYSYRGVVALCQHLADENLSAQAAIIAEPTELRAVIASKGVLRWRIRVTGRAAHSGKPHLGINAITHMARIILAIEADHQRLAASPHPLLGPATVSVGVISGGVQVNVVPDTCAIEIDRRLLPGETPAAVLQHYQQMLDILAAQHPTLQATQEPPLLIDEALDTAATAPAAQHASHVLKNLGLDPRLVGVPFGSDASKLSRQGIPSLVFGPGSIDQAHAAIEYIELAQVEQALAFYRDYALGWGRVDGR